MNQRERECVSGWGLVSSSKQDIHSRFVSPSFVADERSLSPENSHLSDTTTQISIFFTLPIFLIEGIIRWMELWIVSSGLHYSRRKGPQWILWRRTSAFSYSVWNVDSSSSRGHSSSKTIDRRQSNIPSPGVWLIFVLLFRPYLNWPRLQMCSMRNV